MTNKLTEKRVSHPLSEPIADNDLLVVVNVSNTGETESGMTEIATGEEMRRNMRRRRKVVPVASAAEPAINTDLTDVAVIAALGEDITDLSANLTGTPDVWDLLIVEMVAAGAGRTIDHGAKFASGPAAVVSTLAGGDTALELFRWTGAVWQCLAAEVIPA